jgi:uncharacterized protein
MDEKKASKKITLNIDLRLICVLLLVVIVAMLAVWRPWQDAKTDDSRKISVSGEASLKAEPDEYQFNPYYEKDTTAEITTLNDKVVKGLKDLGVSDAQIKNNASRYGSPEIHYTYQIDGKEKSTLNLTITVNNKELSQKVQDYLLTTDPKGTITPSPSFSTSKKKELEDKLRDEAIADARKRAGKTAEGFGAKIGKVIEVSELSDGGVYPYDGLMSNSMAMEDGQSRQGLSIQPGQDELTYKVKVIFALK